jgi:hypothetical protein
MGKFYIDQVEHIKDERYWLPIQFTTFTARV